MLHVAVPGGDDLRLEHLVMDVNGTLSVRGELIDGVHERLTRLRADIALHLLTADTFGTARSIAVALSGEFKLVRVGAEKRSYIEQLGARSCVAIGNGSNDVPMFEAAGLAIVVLGPEGTSYRAVAAATVICRSVVEALDLLLSPETLIATLRP